MATPCLPHMPQPGVEQRRRALLTMSSVASACGGRANGAHSGVLHWAGMFGSSSVSGHRCVQVVSRSPVAAAFVAEIVRLKIPVRSAFRKAAQDTSVSGIHVPKGTHVVVSLQKVSPHTPAPAGPTTHMQAQVQVPAFVASLARISQEKSDKTQVSRQFLILRVSFNGHNRCHIHPTLQPLPCSSKHWWPYPSSCCPCPSRR